MCYYDQTGRSAGEECSSTYEGRHITVLESELTHPTHGDGFVDGGDPVLHGDNIVGVAFKSAAAATDYIAIDTEGIWWLTVYGTNEDGNVAVTYGDDIYIAIDGCLLSKNNNKATHRYFGRALDAVVSGTSEVIPVKLHTGEYDAVERVGTSAVPLAMNTADAKAYQRYYSSTATSGTTYVTYDYLSALGAGQEAIACRDKVLVGATGVGQAYGNHSTVETATSAGTITGQCAGLRSNLVVANRDHGGGGTYFGVLAEIFPLGNTAALPTSNACLGIQSVAGTAMDAVANAIGFYGTDGSGKMIYTNADADTATGSIRITINGAVKYLRFYDAEA